MSSRNLCDDMLKPRTQAEPQDKVDIMELRDLFVATVAMTIGSMMIYTSILNEGWCFQMKVARVIAETKGRDKARTFIGGVGTFMLLLGLYILIAPLTASSWLNWDESRNIRVPHAQPVVANAE